MITKEEILKKFRTKFFTPVLIEQTPTSMNFKVLIPQQEDLEKYLLEEVNAVKDQVITEVIESLELHDIFELYKKKPIDDTIKRIGSEVI